MLEIIQLKKEDFYNEEHELRKKSSLVLNFDEEFQKEVDGVIETFHNWKIAVGLSAPQVGIRKRFAIINISKGKAEEDIIIVNPIVTNISGKKDIKYESCLSLPKVRGSVERRYKISFQYQDRIGNKHSMNADGFLARVILHEIDHLDGVLFVDRMKNEHSLETLDIVWE